MKTEAAQRLSIRQIRIILIFGLYKANLIGSKNKNMELEISRHVIGQENPSEHRGFLTAVLPE